MHSVSLSVSVYRERSIAVMENNGHRAIVERVESASTATDVLEALPSRSQPVL